jgi:hypothetical protein
MSPFLIYPHPLGLLLSQVYQEQTAEEESLSLLPLTLMSLFRIFLVAVFRFRVFLTRQD